MAAEQHFQPLFALLLVVKHDPEAVVDGEDVDAKHVECFPGVFLPRNTKRIPQDDDFVRLAAIFPVAFTVIILELSRNVVLFVLLKKNLELKIKNFYFSFEKLTSE